MLKLRSIAGAAIAAFAAAPALALQAPAETAPAAAEAAATIAKGDTAFMIIARHATPSTWVRTEAMFFVRASPP